MRLASEKYELSLGVEKKFKTTKIITETIYSTFKLWSGFPMTLEYERRLFPLMQINSMLDLLRFFG